MAKGKLRRARQALSRSNFRRGKGKLGAYGNGKPVAAGGKLPWTTTNGKFVEAGQRKSSVVGQRQGQTSIHGKGKLRANGKDKLPSRQMTKDKGLRSNGKGKLYRSTAKGKASSLHGKGKFRHGKASLLLFPPMRPVQRSHGM